MSTDNPSRHADNLRRWAESGQPRAWVEARGGQWDNADWLALIQALERSAFWPLDPAAVGAVLETTRNLSRWVASGAPARWVTDRRGRWNHDDWLALLADLQKSAYWPLDPDAVGLVLQNESRRRELNLRRWERSGQAQAWVDARQGAWNHEDWLALLDRLRHSPFWPLDPAAVGEILAGIQEEWHNLRRWQDSGQPARWVADRQGRWGDEDWRKLLEELQQSDFWPLAPESAERVLKQATAEWCNLRRWQDSGQPWRWVKDRQGQWGHDDWLALLDSLRHSQYWPLDERAVGELLERVKREYANLRRWRDSGQARRWLEERAGRNGNEDGPALLQALQQSGFWPINPAMARVELDMLLAESRNVRRWQESGAAWKWVEAREGCWGAGEWAALLDGLRRTEFWPMDPAEVGRAVEEVKLQWWNLRRWRTSGLARRWVEVHQGRWDAQDRSALLADLRAAGLWPVDVAALGRVLDEVRAEWVNLRRWEVSGAARQWVDSRGGRWSDAEWRALLESLRGSPFWPLDPHAVQQVLERLRAPGRRAA
jgi:hypothetical protein